MLGPQPLGLYIEVSGDFGRHTLACPANSIRSADSCTHITRGPRYTHAAAARRWSICRLLNPPWLWHLVRNAAGLNVALTYKQANFDLYAIVEGLPDVVRHTVHQAIRNGGRVNGDPFGRSSGTHELPPVPRQNIFEHEYIAGVHVARTSPISNWACSLIYFGTGSEKPFHAALSSLAAGVILLLVCVARAK